MFEIHFIRLAAVVFERQYHTVNLILQHVFHEGEAELAAFFILSQEDVLPVNYDLIMCFEDIDSIGFQAVCHVNSHYVGIAKHLVASLLVEMSSIYSAPAAFRFLSLFIDSVLKTHVVRLHAFSLIEQQSELIDAERTELSQLILRYAISSTIEIIDSILAIKAKSQACSNSVEELNLPICAFACRESHFVVCSAIVIEGIIAEVVLCLHIELEGLRLVLPNPILFDEFHAFSEIEHPSAITLVFHIEFAPLITTRTAVCGVHRPAENDVGNRFDSLHFYLFDNQGRGLFVGQVNDREVFSRDFLVEGLASIESDGQYQVLYWQGSPSFRKENLVVQAAVVAIDIIARAVLSLDIELESSGRITHLFVDEVDTVAKSEHPLATASIVQVEGAPAIIGSQTIRRLVHRGTKDHVIYRSSGLNYDLFDYQRRGWVLGEINVWLAFSRE